MKIRITVFAAFAFLFSSSLLAGGSVDRRDIEPILVTNPTIARILSEAIILEEGGSAVRLGRHYGPIGAARIGPYEFRARHAGDPEGEYPLVVTLFTKCRLVDRAGQPLSEFTVDVPEIPTPEMGDDVVVEEKLIRIAIEAAE